MKIRELLMVIIDLNIKILKPITTLLIIFNFIINNFELIILKNLHFAIIISLFLYNLFPIIWFNPSFIILIFKLKIIIHLLASWKFHIHPIKMFNWEILRFILNFFRFFLRVGEFFYIKWKSKYIVLRLFFVFYKG